MHHDRAAVATAIANATHMPLAIRAWRHSQKERNHDDEWNGQILYVTDDRSVAEFELTGANSLRGPKVGLSGNSTPKKIAPLADVFKDDAKYRRADEEPSAPATKLTETLSKIDKKNLSHLIADAMSGKAGLLSLVPGRALFSELGTDLAEAQSYMRLKESMDAGRGDWHVKTD